MKPQPIEESFRYPDGWEQAGQNGLRRLLELPNWREALIFAEMALEQGEEHGRMPEVTIRDRRVMLSLPPHGCAGLAAKDLELAWAIDAAITEGQAAEAAWDEPGAQEALR